MATGDLNSGERFGLPPIGLTQATLDTPPSDTARRSFPGLATKGSVFTWNGSVSQICSRTAVTGTISDSINLRSNTATGGSSIDVPTWAAGAVISFDYRVVTMGTSTYHAFAVVPALLQLTAVSQISAIRGAVTAQPLGLESQQAIIPFYDEPVVTVSFTTDGTGTSTYRAFCIGFVRNV